MNWGKGITIFYICFMAAMIFMVIKSAHNPSDLVQENYYQKDLTYEDFRQKREKGKQAADHVDINYDSRKRSLAIQFNSSIVSPKGKVMLFRPSNKAYDQSYPLKVEADGYMGIDLPRNLPGGLWRVFLDWESNGEAFYLEQQVIL